MRTYTAALLAVFSLAACSIPVTMHKDLAVSGSEQSSSERCSECHSVIYEEWKGSGHSRAYTNPVFRSITNEYMVSVCVGCHSPESVFSDETRLRQAYPEEGVNCQTCHLHRGVLQGPVEKHLPFDIHPVMEKNQAYLKSSLCGNCHRKAYEEYIAAGEKEKTCQNCHMPEARRTIIDNRPWVWLKAKYLFRKHSFDIQDREDISERIGLEIYIKEGPPLSGEIIVENRSVPHNIPTGGYGYHEIILNIQLIDDMGETVEKMTYSMTGEMGTSLKKGERRSVPFLFSNDRQPVTAIKAALVKTDFSREHLKVLKEMLHKLKSEGT